MDINRFEKLPIMGILRGIKVEFIDALIEVIIRSGLETVEITMNTFDAVNCIKRTVRVAQGRLMIGAGTVLSLETMHKAIDAGAGFIVMPIFVEEIVSYCKNNNIPVFPGALSPQEVYHAYLHGATMVKVFPSRLFGPKYFNELKGPFDSLKLLAVGGVRLENIREYFNYKADGVAIGGSVFDLDKIHAGHLQQIQEDLSSLVEAVKSRVS